MDEGSQGRGFPSANFYQTGEYGHPDLCCCLLQPFLWRRFWVLSFGNEPEDVRPGRRKRDAWEQSRECQGTCSWLDNRLPFPHFFCRPFRSTAAQKGADCESKVDVSQRHCHGRADQQFPHSTRTQACRGAGEILCEILRWELPMGIFSMVFHCRR
eukprot:TRINITY_DN2743_c0_g1_i3.p2 TRINITY_DN2743_c0_g1~~TRINITY_DN2743_c0_g1_i3.p2  ORF type:complete len:156 (-),score=3.11 TRINITY_DN2743_c0_g1_i3:1822-2289(-)